MNPAARSFTVVFLLALGALATGWGRPAWQDEYITYAAMEQPLAGMLAERLAHNHFPTYFVLARGWVAAVGLSLDHLRVLSAIPVAAACGLLFLLVRRATAPGVAALACALFLLNTHTLFAGQVARMYGLLALGEVLLLAWLLTRPRRGNAAYLALALGGLAVHPLFPRMAVIATLFAVWERRAEPGAPHRNVWILLSPLLAGAVGVAVLLLARDAERPPILVVPPSLEAAGAVLFLGLREAVKLPVGDFACWPALQRGVVETLCSLGLAALAVAAVRAAWRRLALGGSGAERSLLRAALLFAVVPLLLHFLALPFSAHFAFQPRYLQASVLGFALLLASWLRGLPTARGRAGATASLLAIHLALAAGYLRGPGDGTREALAAWQAQARGDDVLLLMPGDFWTLAARMERQALPGPGRVLPVAGMDPETLRGRLLEARGTTGWLLCRGGPRFCRNLPAAMADAALLEPVLHQGESCLYRVAEGGSNQ